MSRIEIKLIIFLHYFLNKDISVHAHITIMISGIYMPDLYMQEGVFQICFKNLGLSFYSVKSRKFQEFAKSFLFLNIKSNIDPRSVARFYPWKVSCLGDK